MNDTDEIQICILSSSTYLKHLINLSLNFCIIGLEYSALGEVSCHQGACFISNFSCYFQSSSIQFFNVIFSTDLPQLFAVTVILKNV